MSLDTFANHANYKVVVGRIQKIAMQQTMPDSKTVLIVEDDLMLSQLMADVVRGFGLDVVSANSASRAIELTKDEELYDVLISDVLLGAGSTGFKLAAKLREARPDLPVIYMSRVTDYTSEEIGSAHTPILKKPIPVGVLEKALNKALTLV